MTSPKPWKRITWCFFLLRHANSSSPCCEKAAHSIDFLVVAENQILPEIMVVKVKAVCPIRTRLPLLHLCSSHFNIAIAASNPPFYRISVLQLSVPLLFSTNPQWGTPRSRTDLWYVGNLLPSNATFKVWDNTSGRAINGGSVWQALGIIFQGVRDSDAVSFSATAGLDPDKVLEIISSSTTEVRNVSL